MRPPSERSLRAAQSNIKRKQAQVHAIRSLLSQRIYSESVVTKTTRSTAAETFSLQFHLPRDFNSGRDCDMQQTVFLLVNTHVRLNMLFCGFSEGKSYVRGLDCRIWKDPFDQSLDSTDRLNEKSSFSFTKSALSGKRSALTSTGCPPCFMKKFP